MSAPGSGSVGPMVDPGLTATWQGWSSGMLPMGPQLRAAPMGQGLALAKSSPPHVQEPLPRSQKNRATLGCTITEQALPCSQPQQGMRSGP